MAKTYSDLNLIGKLVMTMEGLTSLAYYENEMDLRSFLAFTSGYPFKEDIMELTTELEGKVEELKIERGPIVTEKPEDFFVFLASLEFHVDRLGNLFRELEPMQPYMNWLPFDATLADLAKGCRKWHDCILDIRKVQERPYRILDLNGQHLVSGDDLQDLINGVRRSFYFYRPQLYIVERITYSAEALKIEVEDSLLLCITDRGDHGWTLVRKGQNGIDSRLYKKFCDR